MIMNQSTTTTAKDINTTEINEHFFFARLGSPNVPNIQAVQVICFALALFVLILVLWCIWGSTPKSGYANLPVKEFKEDESADDVISEITGRREVVLPPVRPVPTTSSKLGIQSNVDLSHVPSNKSQQSTSAEPAHPSASDSIRPEETKPPPSSEQQSDAVIAAPLIALDDCTHSKLQCPSRRLGSINLMPHDLLVKPLSSNWQRNELRATASYSEPSFTKVSMDDLLSLTTKEKIQTRSDFVLTPQITPSSSHTSINMSQLSQPQPNELEPVLELTLEQKQEERDKFLKEYSNKMSSRRRSLCNVVEDHSIAPATKAHSMPAMSIGPYISDADALANLHTNYEQSKHPSCKLALPPSLQFSPLGALRKKISGMSLTTKELEEMTDALSLLAKISKGETLESSPKTSTTSIWSSIASENAVEPDRVSLCSRRTSLEDVPASWNKLVTILEDSDSEGQSVAEEKIVKSTPIVMGVTNLQTKNRTVSKVRKVKRLTTAERIDLAAKVLGFVSPEGSNDTGFLLESDLIPSEIFSNSRESSAVSSNDQFWSTGDTGKQGVHNGRFWAEGIVNNNSVLTEEERKALDELDSYRITSKLKETLKASRSRSYEGLNIRHNYQNPMKQETE